MIKLVILIKAKEGISPAAFKAYYEEHHAPLAVRLLPMVSAYQRNFVDRESMGNRADAAPEFDVITQMWFADEAAYAAFRERLSDPEIRRQIRADEANFLQSDWTRSFLVDERASTIAGKTAPEMAGAH